MIDRVNYAAFAIGFMAIWAIVQFFLLLDQQPTSSGYTISLILSGILCLVVMYFPTRNHGIVSPPFILGALTLVFFPVFSIFYLYFPELGKWYHQFFSMQFFHRNLAVVSIYYCVALVLFLIGYVFGETALGKAGLQHKRTSSTLGRKAALLAIVLGIIGMFAYATSLGGVSVIIEQMSNMQLRREWRESGSSLYYYVGMLLLTAPMVYFLLIFSERKTLSSVLPATLWLVLSSTVMLVSQGSREKAIFPILLTVIALLLMVRSKHLSAMRRKVRFAASFLAIVVIVAFSIQTVFRWTRIGATEDATILQKLSDFNRIDISMVMFVDYFSEQRDGELLFGGPILSYFNQILVRLFDFEPIMNTSVILHALIFNGNNAAGYPGSPLAGELYLNFGYAGFAFFLVFGAFFGVSYKRLVASDFELWRCIFFSAHIYFFMSKMCIYIGLSESILMLILTYVPLVVFKTLSRVRDVRPARQLTWQGT
jgi:oligosaccharide repeat unit polymerase